tara:strand:+ start:759 stop:995 length:237 start_codon:yes stop_codon:yes gene_type:complete
MFIIVHEYPNTETRIVIPFSSIAYLEDNNEPDYPTIIRFISSESSITVIETLDEILEQLRKLPKKQQEYLSKFDILKV